jgi:uncharacterized protein (DUF58 family)
MTSPLTPEELRMLEGFRLNPRRAFRGGVRGERLTKRRGLSIEFADYRDYTEGDDLRHLDWNVLARLQTPLIKTYQDEEDLAVYLLVDHSASMEFGTPTKKEVALRLAMAFGYVALGAQDAVMPATVPAREPARTIRGRSGFGRLAFWGEQVRQGSAERVKPLSQSLREFLSTGPRPGVVMLLSDGLDPEVTTQLKVLGSRGFELNFVQILAPEEMDPDLEGDLRLIDAETGAMVEITANSYALKAYREALGAHNESLAEACRRAGGRYLRTKTTDSLASLIRGPLRREGWFTT